MPQNSNFRLPRGYRFKQNSTLRLGGKSRLGPLGSILGPMGSHWVQKLGQNRKKITMSQNTNFRLPRGHRFRPKFDLWLWRQSQWRHPRVHLGANGVPLVPKNGTKPLNITMPPISDFRLPRGHRFRPKFDFTVMEPNHSGDPLGSILGPMGSHWVQEMGQNH